MPHGNTIAPIDNFNINLLQSSHIKILSQQKKGKKKKIVTK